MFTPFKMPDFCFRPDGQTKSLKAAYVHLRRMGVPDKDIFIYAQGEFNQFKGEILDQQPQAGDMVLPGNKITLIAAVPGISQMMPDLFTDNLSDYLIDDNNPRHGVKKLFAIFDSLFLKMLCRLEWIRDIYAGVHHSTRFIDYLNSICCVPETGISEFNFNSMGYIPSRLSRFLGTEGGLRVFLEAAIGLKVKTRILGNQEIPAPGDTLAGLGAKSRLGENIFVGDRFEGDKPKLEVSFQLDKPEDVLRAIKIIENKKFLEDMFRLVLPYYVDQCEISIEPTGEEITFVNGNSYLGFSTAINTGESERS